MLYLTPERFRTMGVGSDLSDVEEWELRSILQSASRSADSYCNVPILPNRFSFRGGTMTNEEHMMENSRRIRLRARPILGVTSLAIYATSTQYLQVNPARLYIEDEEGWVEIVEASLSSVGLWGAAMVPGIGLESFVVRTTYTYGYRFPVVGEYLEPTDARTYRALNQFWLEGGDVTVYVNGTERSTGITVDTEEGSVVFANDVNAPDLDDVVTADYTYTLPYEVARATALIAASSISERDLVGKGLGNLAEIAVEEVRLRRDARKSGTVVSAEAIPSAAVGLLEGFRFISVR
jgi:hypothetical protein